MLVCGSTVHHSTSRLWNSQLRFPKSILGQVLPVNHSNGHFFEGKVRKKMYHNVAIFRHTYTMTCFFMILGKPKSGFMSLIIFILYSICIVLIFVAHLFRPELRLPPTPFWLEKSAVAPGPDIAIALWLGFHKESSFLNATTLPTFKGSRFWGLGLPWPHDLKICSLQR